MNKKKFPSIPYLSVSPTIGRGDSVVDASIFNNWHVTVTEKMDGENTILYSNAIHARSPNSTKANEFRSEAWAKHAEIRSKIGEDVRVCCENVFATHSIKYDDDIPHLMMYGVFVHDSYMPWSAVEIFSEVYGIPTVPVLYSGMWNYEKVREIYDSILEKRESEGFVVRLSLPFAESRFRVSIAKYVRENHVQSSHWMYGQGRRQ